MPSSFPSHPGGATPSPSSSSKARTQPLRAGAAAHSPLTVPAASRPQNPILDKVAVFVPGFCRAALRRGHVLPQRRRDPFPPFAFRFPIFVHVHIHIYETPLSPISYLLSPISYLPRRPPPAFLQSLDH